MDHHRSGDIVENTCAQQDHLAAASFLGRRAYELDPHAEFVGDRREPQRAADGGGTVDVVSARVPDPRQSIVFGAESDGQLTVAIGGGECGIQAAHVAFDGETRRGDEVGDLCA